MPLRNNSVMLANDKEIVSIIGYGIIGKAVYDVFREKCHVLINDQLYYGSSSLLEIAQKSILIFICIPASTLQDGNIYTRDVFGILSIINNHCLMFNKKVLVCIKTTLLPQYLDEIVELNPMLRVCFAPEYARGNSAVADMRNMESLVIGGDHADAEDLSKIYLTYGSFNKEYQIAIVDIATASLLKYMENCFLAMKVTFMNQFFDIAKSINCSDSWDKMMVAFHQDSRMGNSHYDVPGPDLKRGWGGACLPKDLHAIIYFCKSRGLDVSLIEHVVSINAKIRET